MLLTTLLAAAAGLAGLTHAQDTTSEVDLILQRRRVDMAGFTNPAVMANVSMWLESQTEEGVWADVDYRLGCDAQRANWPIQQHWIRVIAFASAWSGLNPYGPEEYKGDDKLLQAALKGMDWWFTRDFTDPGCKSQGGVNGSTCPCGTPGTWNTNWFSNVILIPQLATTACLIVMPANLTDLQKEKCVSIPNRAWEVRDLNNPGFGVLTGANMVNVMQNSISMALFSGNEVILTEAFSRAMGSFLFADIPIEDGIHRDGSFLQHAGILYNGNYGKDSLNAFIQLEGEAIGTSFAANDTVREAVAALVRGDEWMIYVDQKTQDQMRWDFNVIGRFIAFAVRDLQASGDINFNVTKLAAALADFSGPVDLSDTLERLKSNGSKPLTGNKGFWASDYMVHRGTDYVLTNKMLSTRSFNTEYTNSANPYGYHLGQGTLWSYVTGNEYMDLQAAWDWHLIPGTTVYLHAPPLSSAKVGVAGNKSYVGVVSDGTFGASAMDYIDPADGSLAYRKAWFFFDDSVLVTTTAVTENRTPAIGDAPVITVLDQRSAADGAQASVNGRPVTISDTLNVTATTLFYAGNGYLSHGTPFNLTLSQGARTGNWSAISTSRAGVQTVDIFSAYTTIPATTYSYTYFPATDASKLRREARHPSTVPLDLDGVLGAAGKNRLALIFWPGSPLTATVPHHTCGWFDTGFFTVSVDQPVALLFKLGRKSRGRRTLTVTVADPNQSLSSVKISLGSTTKPLTCIGAGCITAGKWMTIDVTLPTGGLQGSSVSVDIGF